MAEGDILVVGTPRASLTPMELLDRALTSGANVETLNSLMELQERWEHNQAKKAFDEAIAAAKSEIGPIRKNRHVGYDSKKADSGRTEYSHEDFAEIAKQINPILANYGLSYRFRTASPVDGPVSVTCIISHRLGYSEENSLQAPRDVSGSKNPIQAIGSTVTYLQRYTLKAALGLAAENDDDGQQSGAPIIQAKVENPETGRMVNPNSSAQLKKSKAWESFSDKLQHFEDARDLDGLKIWFASQEVTERIYAWPSAWRENAQSAYDQAHDRIEALIDA